MRWMTALCASALLAGCAVNRGSFCDIASEQYFGGVDTIDWLAENDPRLLADIVTHNEQILAICTPAL